MSNLVTVNQPAAPTKQMQSAPVSAPMLAWLQDPAKRKLCRETFAASASDAEFELFLLTAANSGLDPFKRQIFLVPRWDAKLQRMVYTPQTSIDGFRVIAERTGAYAGQVGPYWCGPDGKWTEVWLSKNPPAAAKVGVIRSDFKDVLWAVARFDAYVQTTKDGRANSTWSKMPDIMSAKCAESLALRKAFPDQLSGLYTEDEMAQANNQEPEDRTPAQPAAAAIPAAKPKAKAKPVEPPKEQPAAAQRDVTLPAPPTLEEALDFRVMFGNTYKGSQLRQFSIKNLEGYVATTRKHILANPAADSPDVQRFFQCAEVIMADAEKAAGQAPDSDDLDGFLNQPEESWS